MGEGRGGGDTLAHTGPDQQWGKRGRPQSEGWVARRTGEEENPPARGGVLVMGPRPAALFIHHLALTPLNTRNNTRPLPWDGRGHSREGTQPG